jgi:LuxR family maltose regulon positive regulatory protein
MDRARRGWWGGRLRHRIGTVVVAATEREGGKERQVRDRVRGVPDLPGELVSRPRLLEQMDRIGARRVGVVSAPAGTGKSTLVAQWCRQRATGRRIQWHDASAPSQLLDAVLPAPGVTVVIDGVDTVALADVALDVARAFASAEGARLLIVGRCPLPAGLVSLVLAGRAGQLEADELRLDATELVQVMRSHAGRPVAIEDPATAVELFDGWMAAVALAGLSHSGGHLAADLAYERARDSIDAYVAAEALRGLDPAQRAFLLATAGIEELEPSLCNALTGRDDSERTTASIRRSGVPTIRLAGDRLRLYRPVREALARLARREDPAGRSERLRAAAEWYSARQLPFEAASCLAELGAWGDIGDLIAQHLPLIVQRDELDRLANIVQNAPPDVFRDHGTLALGASWVLRMEGRISAARELLGIYEPYMSERAKMVADQARANVASWTSDTIAAQAFADRAISRCEQLGDDAFDCPAAPSPMAFGETSTDVYRLLARAAALLACTYGGRWDQAVGYVPDIRPDTMARLPQIRAIEVLGIRATYAALAGRARDAKLDAHTALAIAAQLDVTDNRVAADAYFALGEAERLMLRHDEAAEPLRRARELAEVNGRVNLIAAAAAAQASLAIDSGKPEIGAQLIAELTVRHTHRFPETVAGLLAAAEARALVAAGRHEAALRTVETAPLTPANASAKVIALLAAGDVAGAQRAVQQWPVAPTTDAAARRALAAAVICDHIGDSRRSSLMRTALAAARSDHLVQPFVEFGTGLTRLFRRVAKDDTPFTHDLHRWFEADSNLIEPARFTAREATVMSHVADGKKLRDIAAEINVSIHTVRTHVRTAYRKLGVDNRADAIRAWRTRSAREPADPIT